MEKLDMKTKCLANENFEKLKALFPNAITETIDDEGNIVRAVDKDILMQEISAEVVEGREERYQFTWPDKRQALATANSPISKTLRPCREESVNFDETENLYIEGENLEVLKLLQETYLGKIKMIYIDPPYNTGNDFVYNDTFSIDREEYLEGSGQYDEYGNRLEKNLESNGRFHTDWLNMMYPRLKLARNLLTDDGVICISIDDNEAHNLKIICDDVFGESNFINTISVKMSTASGVKLSHRDKTILKTKEYILVYCKNKDLFSINPQYVRKEKWDDYYEWFVDKEGDKVSDWKVYKLDEVLKEKKINSKDLDNLDFKEFYFNNADKIWQRGRNTSIPKEILEKSKQNWETIFEYGDPEEPQYCYKGRRMAFLKNVLKDCISNDGKLEIDLGTLICDFWDHISTAALFSEGGVSFPNGKKPQLLLITLLRMFTNENDIVLDFFSGSASTAEAVFKLNNYDEKNNKFILVQLPEEMENKSEFEKISDLGKERIRKAGNKILEENLDKEKIETLDIGFRVLKVDSSNMKEVFYAPEKTEQTLLDMLSDNIKEDRTPEDLLFQVMLDLGISLSSNIKKEIIDNKEVFIVEEGFLIACFDKNITEETVKAIAKEGPYYAVFRDSSMGNDSVATNFEQIFKNISSQTIRKVV